MITLADHEALPFSSLRTIGWIGWWSTTGKPENPTGDYRQEESCNALHLQWNGNLFYRDHAFSIRGTYYHGTWKRDTENPNQLWYHITQYNNLQVLSSTSKLGAIILDPRGGAIQLSGEISSIPIPPVNSWCTIQ